MVFPWDRVLQTKFLGQSMLTLPCHFLRVLFEERKGQQRLFLRKSSRTHADPGFLPPHPTLKPGQVSALRGFFFFFFCLELCVFLVWAGLGAKSFMPLPVVSCFTLGDDCSVFWASSLSLALPLSFNSPKSLEYRAQPYSFSREHGGCCCHPGGKGLWGREKVEIDR